MRLAFHSVSRQYAGRAGQVLALDQVSLEVTAGEFVCLVGPSGCGKSTLLNMAAGFDRPTAGRVTMDGKEVTGPSITRTMMFQEAALFPWLSARQNVEFGLKSLGLNARARRDRAQHFLDMVQLSAFGDAQPHELSGGMKQRVALARALAVEPSVLLMDEPFAAVDAQTRERLQSELHQLWNATGTTILFVTHNVAEAVALGTRAIVFSARPGRIQEEIGLTHLAHPRTATDPAGLQAIERIGAALRAGGAPDELGEVQESVATLRPSERGTVPAAAAGATGSLAL